MPWAASDIRALPAAIVLAILAGWLGGCSEAEPPPASLVILNGHVQTMAAAMPTASALAIRDGRIVIVGSDEQVRPFIGAGTKVFDAAGATLAAVTFSFVRHQLGPLRTLENRIEAEVSRR